jgi:transportin-1
LISATLEAQALADQYEYAPPNVEVLIAALGLLSGIVQGLGPRIEPLFAQTNLLALLTQCVYVITKVNFFFFINFVIIRTLYLKYFRVRLRLLGISLVSVLIH